MTDAYLPSLHWGPDLQQWIPKQGFTTVELPPEVDPNVLPRPAYRLVSVCFFRSMALRHGRER